MEMSEDEMSKKIKTPIWYKEGSDEISGANASQISHFLAGDDSSWDTILLPFDIEASTAHARGLERAGILQASELAAIEKALEQLRSDWSDGKITVTPEDEDCHTVIERYLVEVIGETGKRIHTGRSRNDQVLAALRLYMIQKLEDVIINALGMTDALCNIAKRYSAQPLPGYTHFQRAMPSSVALWALGFGELMCSDIRSLSDAIQQISVSPLGSAAGFGVPFFNLPREFVADQMGLDRIQYHATSVQLSRGKLEMHAVHALLQVAQTINRLSADIVQFCSHEFSFVDLPAAVTTGSSIMPQKRNPDVFEMARATVHRIAAEMNVLITVPVNLPSGYHRDLQLTKEATMRAMEKTVELTAVMATVLPSVSFNADKINASLTDDLYATAAAYQHVAGGMAFRDAYRAAASDTGSWSDLARQPVEGMYPTPGQPGTENPDIVRRMAVAAASAHK